MTTLRFNIVDVFTDVPLRGNQLAVFTNAAGLDTESMQALAREMGFSESTFVLQPESGGDARVRIFTPVAELPFAGHPVLGTAWVLALPLQLSLLRLETGMGVVPVTFEREGAKLSSGRMSQPVPTVASCDRADELLDALGVAESLLPVEVYDNGVRHVYVMLETADAVAEVSPDAQRLAEVADDCGVSCFAASGARVKTRVFAPALGVAEDPATGSAAGPLAVHLARHGVVGWGEEIEISQGAEMGRPSTLYAQAEGPADDSSPTAAHPATTVEVGGSAVVVARGEFVR